ncbi:HNH endonuclease family protein [Bacteriovoracaceae bacterium]|nr:HNH endonuclease family protein [Bacteriovoracaceae bacterium]
MFALDTATIIPYVLYVLKSNPSEEERDSLFRYLESYLIRRIICKETTKGYNQLFRASLINNEVSSIEKLIEEIEKKSDKVNFMPDDSLLEEAFKESRLTNKQARGVLYLLEKSIRSDLQSTELKSISEFSLEHVMPKKWENHWVASLSIEEKNLRNKKLLTLGNLTIITNKLNSSIRDSSWHDKKVGKGKNKGLSEYSRGIEIFNKYLELDDWNEEVIKARANELYSLATTNVWKLK